jgi:hypothetical protein
MSPDRYIQESNIAKRVDEIFGKVLSNDVV